MFKEEIATALKTKYQRFGLSNEAIDRIAEAREKTVTSEGEIEAATADVVTMELIANELQKMRDKEIGAKTDLQRAFDSYKEKNPEGGKDPNQKPDPKTDPKPNPNEPPEPAWAKALRERYEREDKEKADKELRDTLKARLKTEGCSNSGIVNLIMSGFVSVKDESEDDAVKRLKEAYSTAYRETFGEGGLPGLGSGQQFIDPKSATDHKNDFLRKQGLLPKLENK